MTFGSVCSGIEAASVAWLPLGWRCAWVAEIEKFCCALLKARYPEVPNYGDFTKIKDAERPDVLVGGTPCQSFSVAGRRGGLDDPRGVLAFEFLALAGRIKPSWLVFENVPGLLSSDEGRDFGAFLGALAKLGYGWAYRILDAQFFGLAQRRERLFLVGYLGDWRPPAAVLFEPESLRWDTPPRRETGQITTFLTANGVGAGGGPDDNSAQGNHIIPILEVHGGSSSQGKGPNGVGVGSDGDPMYTLQSGKEHAVAFNNGVAVRRLTPREWERLQGFPDDYTLIQYRGKPAADGPRYKALGNSMAVPVVQWIGRRIAVVDQRIADSAHGHDTGSASEIEKVEQVREANI